MGRTSKGHTYVQGTYVGVRADATLTRSQIGTRACARVDTTPCCVSLRHIKMPINASRAECGPESPPLPRQEASQQKELREMSHGSTSVARTSDRLDEHPGTGRGKTIECTTHPPCAGGGQCMGGGTKHVTLRRFEPYRPSCTNLTPILRDSFWLSSSRILHGGQSDHVSPSNLCHPKSIVSLKIHKMSHLQRILLQTMLTCP